MNNTLYYKYKFLKIDDIYNYEVGKFMYINDIKALPQIFENYFLSLDLAHNYNTRSKSNKNYFLDFVRTNSGKNSLKFKGVQLWNKMPEVESRTQGSRPRPKTQKNFEAKAKDRPSRGQGQGHRCKCSPKKNFFKNFFQVISKKRSSKIFSGEKGLQKIFFRWSLLEETKKKVFADFPQGFGGFPTKFQRFKN